MKKNTRTKQANRKRVATAIMELLTNPETPEELDDSLTTFLCEAGTGSIAGRYTEVTGGLEALEHLLAFAEWEKANQHWERGDRDATAEVSHATN